MHTIKQFSRSIALLLLALVFGTTAPAFAVQSRDTTVAHSSSSSSSETEVETEHGSTVVSSTSEAGDDSAHTELHARGDSLVANLRKVRGDKEKTPAQRQKVCENNKKNLGNKFSHIVSNSQKVQTRIDGIYTKALAYQTSKNLQPANFDAVVTSANSAKAASAASVAALKAVSPTVDCSSTTVANDVATFKAATQTARDNLKSYRTAVKAVLKSLEATKVTTGGNQ